MTSATYWLLDGVADSFNPLLAVIGLTAPFLRRPRALLSTIVFYSSAGAAIGFVYVLRAFDIHHQIWGRFALDFSTHSAFAASLVVSLSAFNRRWVGPLVVLTVLYFCLQLMMRYHSVADIISSASVAGAAALLLHLIAVRTFRMQVNVS